MIKKVIILICLIQSLFSLKSFAEDSIPEYPKFYIISRDTVGVILTIDQAETINNDLELFQLLESMRYNCDSTLHAYVTVVNKYDIKIAQMSSKISELQSIDTIKTEKIEDLKNQIVSYKETIKNKNIQLSDKDQIIVLDKKQIRKLKIERTIGCGGSISFLITSLILFSKNGFMF